MKINKENVHRLLASDRPGESIATLVQYWSPRALRCQREPRLGLSEPEFNVHVIVIYDGEVGNGGHSQFFLNPSGSHAQAVASPLGALGLESLAGVFAKACSVFPGGIVPPDHEVRSRLVEELPHGTWQKWSSLDREYYSLNQGLDEQLLEYLRAEAKEVLVPERAP